MAKKKKHAEHENHERWLVSYADLLTLLFALFVVLYAFASAKQSESKQLVQALMQSFSDMGYTTSSSGSSVLTSSPNVMSSGESSEQASIPASKPSMLVQAPTQGGGGVMDVGASTTVPQPPSKSKGEDKDSGANNPKQTSVAAQVGASSSGAPFDKIRQELRTALQQQISQGSVSFSETEDWLTVELNSDLVFPAGSTTLLKRSLPVIHNIAGIVKPMNNYIRVRGYTDNTGTTPELYASNWELSAKRAEAVLVTLQQDGIIPDRMALEAYGEYSPFVSNSTEEGRKRNRKVTIAISKYVREIKALEVVSPVAVKKEDENKPSVNTDNLKVIQLPDGRFKVESR
jgi:chemotaxis protein MotB